MSRISIAAGVAATLALAALPGALCLAAPIDPQAAGPYPGYQFRLKWDGRYVAGIAKVGPLSSLTEATGAADPAGLPSAGRTRYEPIVLERGVTRDTAFEAWAGLVAAQSTQSYYKDVYLELYNAAGQLVMAYQLLRCWPTAYVALSALDATTGAGQFQRLTLQCDSWRRDTAVVPPP
jgi:phage tail-like protein